MAYGADDRSVPVAALAVLLARMPCRATSTARLTYSRPVPDSLASLTLALSSFFWIFATSA